jgi:hypothetical protein
VALPSPDALGELGQRTVEQPDRVEEPPRPGVAPLDDVEQGVDRAVARRQRGVGPAQAGREPVEQRGGRAVASHPDGGVEGDGDRRGPRRPGGQRDLVAVDHQPAAGWLGVDGLGLVAGAGGPAHGAVADLEQLRRGQRGDEDHEQQRGVEVVADHPGLQAERGEDEADLAAGQHAQPDEQLVAG